jgi:ribulose-phosphate 3-epimerase
MVSINASVLACNYRQIENEIKAVNTSGANRIHLDIMDGHFVPNLSFGVDMIEVVASCTDLPIDVHLMVMHPRQFSEKLVLGGAASITAHVELGQEYQIWLHEMHKSGYTKTGIAICPDTHVRYLERYKGKLERVLVMGVTPGVGGQTFIPSVSQKIKDIGKLNLTDRLEVDGGITAETASLCLGATDLIAGTAIFKTQDYKRAIDILRGGANGFVN